MDNRRTTGEDDGQEGAEPDQCQVVGDTSEVRAPARAEPRELERAEPDHWQMVGDRQRLE